MKPLQVIKNNVCVTLEHIGEGFDGDYDPANREDCPLVRFSVMIANPMWEPVDDGSCCTLLDARLPRSVLRKAAKTILGDVYDAVIAGYSIKKACDRLSWGT